MANNHASLWPNIVRSLRNGEFAAAILWGTLVGCFAVILEYNISSLITGENSVRYGMFVGGIVAGTLYADSWRAAAKAGSYAGALPAIVLGPIAYLFFMLEYLPTIQIDGDALIWTIGSILMLYPFLILFGLLSGLLGGIIGYVIATTILSIQWSS